ncbi:uncharacterized protein LOC131427257 [Malaya genurostris]|uniref:uncharacterized protein LOC131427257 n=1 Tax=Malaya genurostris TaxID=325434 RepID=UPI0026F3FA6C|nr:uncharacterized protein LOC131427257 [Malaya genurostris]
MQRYTLNLGQIFLDHRQKVFVCRRNSWKLVSCLQDYLRSTFNLKGTIYLTNENDVLFPESENIDIFQENDQIIVHVSTDTQPIDAQIKENGLPRDCNLNGKRTLERSDDSDSCSDNDNLPQIFAKVESLTKNNDVDEFMKPKRKRIRKRKSKTKETEITPKVVVKTYGKGKIPSIVMSNGRSSNHIRFDVDESVKADDSDEPYINLNKNTVPRIVKAISVTDSLFCSQDIPSVPEYEDIPGIELGDVIDNIKGKKNQRKREKSVEIKQETIDIKLKRQASPTWDAEVDQDKEKFIASYSGDDPWNSLRDVLVNFPAIVIPSENDIISYRYGEDSYLSFVECVNDGENDESPALKLMLRRLNTNNSQTMTAALDQLSDIRLIASYQP